jgi:predicted nucleotidyltransferase/DNA-binding XRE family transcriptional regulator
VSVDAGTVASGLLREARSRRGMTQRELAAAAGVPQSLIAKIESGSRQPSLPTLMRLIGAAGFVVKTALSNSVRPAALLRERRDELRDLAGEHGIGRIRVFGSVARGDDRPESDLDLLVDLEPGADPLKQLEFDAAAERLLGCRVDVMTTSSVPDLLRDAVLAEARDLEEV